MIIIYSFYLDFAFLTLVSVYIFFTSVSVKSVNIIAHIFQPCMRNWSLRMR